MLYAMIEHIKNSSFVFPFFFGAAICGLVGGFINLFLISLVIYLGFKLLSVFNSKGEQNAS